MPDEPTQPSEGSKGPSGPTALPPAGARAVAFVAILVAGACGFLIGRSLALLQCTGDCSVQAGLGGLGGALAAAGGVAVIAVLVLRAMGEWQAGAGQRRS